MERRRSAVTRFMRLISICFSVCTIHNNFMSRRRGTRRGSLGQRRLVRTVVQLLLLQVCDQVRVLRGSAGVDACRCSLNALAQEGVLGVDFAAAARPACRAARIAHAHFWPTKQHAHTVSERVRWSGGLGLGLTV